MKIRCLYDKLVPLDELKPHPKNRNKHPKDQIARLAQILEYQGWRYPVKVSKLSGFITSGHGRLEAARKAGFKEVPVNFQEYESKEQEYADLQADNAIALWAELDLSEIKTDISALGDDFDTDLLGIKDLDLGPTVVPQADEDEVPEAPPEPRSKLGDIYQLGRHRLMCGDSTSIDAVERLMDGANADMVFTDPPYGMKLNTDWSDAKSSAKFFTEKGCAGQGNKYRPVIGDNDDFAPELVQTVLAAFPNAREVFMWGADYYAEHLLNRNDGSWIVWDKRENADGSNLDEMFGSCFELCWSRVRHKRRIARVKWSGIFGTEKEHDKKRVHPTQKPAGLAEYFFAQWGKPEDRVADLYGGSGSTLIACEKTNRQCFMMELDPHYVDVIVSRYVKYTGNSSIIRNGEKMDWSVDG